MASPPLDAVASPLSLFLAAAEAKGEPLDVAALRAFRDSLGVRLDDSVVVRARESERY